MSPRALAEESPAPAGLVRSGVAGDLPLDKGTVDAANPGGFSGTVDSVDRRLLPGVDFDEALL